VAPLNEAWMQSLDDSSIQLNFPIQISGGEIFMLPAGFNSIVVLRRTVSRHQWELLPALIN
jgi:hypothetical protein